MVPQEFYRKKHVNYLKFKDIQFFCIIFNFVINSNFVWVYLTYQTTGGTRKDTQTFSEIQKKKIVLLNCILDLDTGIY